MGQIARPTADAGTGGWTPTPVSGQINEASPDDTTRVISGPEIPVDTFVVRLGPLAYPADGPRRLRLRLRRNGPPSAPATVRLLQGGRAVASRVFRPGDAFAEYAFTLSDSEAAAITDYADLLVQVTAGFPVVPCCPDSVPVVLHVTVTDRSGSCAGMPESFPITYDPARNFWIYEDPASPWANWYIQCSGPGPGGFIPTSLLSGSPSPDPDSTCSPLFLIWRNRQDYHCRGGGTVTFIVTE